MILRSFFALFFLAFASIPLSQRFLEIESLSQEDRAHLAPILSSTVRIDSLNGRCTATRIHERGDLLTARHCLVGCLIREKVYLTKLDPQSVDYYVLNEERLGKAECSLSVNGEEKVFLVKHAAPFLIDRFSEQGIRTLNRKLFDELRSQGAMASGDFVILQPKNAEGKLPFVCWKKSFEISSQSRSKVSSNSDLKARSKSDGLFTVGYPSETQRGSFDSDGIQMYFSSGKRLSSFSKGDCYQEAQEKNRPNLLNQFDEPGTFVSTLDAIYGSSGSAVYTHDQAMVGILTNMYAPREKDPSKMPEVHFCAGAAKALELQRIQEIMGEAAQEYQCAEAGQGSAANSP